MSFRACKPRLYLYSVPGTASLVNITLNMRYKNDENIKFVVNIFVFSSSKCTKIRFRTGLRPRPRWGSLRRSPDPLVGWGGGYPLPIPLTARGFRRLELVANGASVLRPPQHKILATPVGGNKLNDRCN